jgi:hypothetical protein
LLNRASVSRVSYARGRTQITLIWTASVVIGIEPMPAQIGGSARVLPDLLHHSA